MYELTVPAEGKEDVSELSIIQKLIMPAAEVLAMDATDYSCGDRLLKGMGKNVRTGYGCSGAHTDVCALFFFVC